MPPGAINWNDADDNNAFHAKTIVMDLDGSISTEVAIIGKKQDYDDIVTCGLADDNDGKPVPSWAFSVCGLIAHVQNEHVWQTAWAEIMKDGAKPEVAADKAFKRIEEIFAKYPITQS